MTTVSRPMTSEQAHKSLPTTSSIRHGSASTLMSDPASLLRNNVRFVPAIIRKNATSNSSAMFRNLLKAQTSKIIVKSNAQRSLSSSPESDPLSRSSSATSNDRVSTAPTSPPSSAAHSDADSVDSSSPKKRKGSDTGLQDESRRVKSKPNEKLSKTTGIVTETSDSDMNNTDNSVVTEEAHKAEKDVPHPAAKEVSTKRKSIDVLETADIEMENTDNSVVAEKVHKTAIDVTNPAAKEISLKKKSTEVTDTEKNTDKSVVTEEHKTANGITHPAAKEPKKRKSSEAGLEQGSSGEKSRVVDLKDTVKTDGDKGKVDGEATDPDTKRQAAIKVPLKPKKGEPIEIPEKFRGPLAVKGLINRHVMCYRNSVIQFMAGSDAFMAELAKHPKECKIQKNCVACSLSSLFADHFLKPGQKGKMNKSAEEILVKLRKVLPDPFNKVKGQEDAFEYFMALREAIEKQHEKLPKGERNSHPAYRAFNGVYPTIIKCLNSDCGSESRTNHDEPQLILDPFDPHTDGRGISVLNKMNNLFKREKVEFRCEKCTPQPKAEKQQKKAKKPTAPPPMAAKRKAIGTAPQFLAINIPRHKLGGAHTQKAKAKAHFPQTLLLPTEDGGKVRYQLKSVIAHMGSTMDSGHYIAYVRKDTRWMMCDDELISQVNWEEVSSCGGGRHQACMLGYEQQQQQ